MNKFELPIVILVCSVLLAYILDMNVVQILGMIALVGGAYVTGKRVRT